MNPACWWLKLLETKNWIPLENPSSSDQVTWEFQCDCIGKTQFHSISNPIYLSNFFFFLLFFLSAMNLWWVAEASCGRKQLISYFLPHQHLHSSNFAGSPTHFLKLWYYLLWTSPENKYMLHEATLSPFCYLKKGSEVGREGNRFFLPWVNDRVSESLWLAPISSVNFLRLYIHTKCTSYLSRTKMYPYFLI